MRTADGSDRPRFGVGRPALAHQGRDARAAAAALPRRGRGTRACPQSDAACGHRRQPHVVPRRPAARRISTRRSDLCRRHVHLQDMVGQAVSRAGEYVPRRPDQSPVDSRNDPRGRRGIGVRDLSGRPHHHHRRADEGLRGSGCHRRAYEGGAPHGADRWRGIHTFLRPCRQGPSAVVSTRPHPHPRAAAARPACRRDRPRAPCGAAARARRRDGPDDVRDRAGADDAVRCAARGTVTARRGPRRGRRHRIPSDDATAA